MQHPTPRKSTFRLPPAVLVNSFVAAISRRNGRTVLRIDPFLKALAAACDDADEFEAARASLLQKVGYAVPPPGRPDLAA